MKKLFTLLTMLVIGISGMWAEDYPVNFDKDQTFTRSDRHINSVTFSFVGAEQTQIVNNVYENTSTKCYQDLTSSKIVKVPTGTSVTPQFNIAGIWQHGFVYIDLNDDGDFTDDGELVSKINQGNPGSNFSLPQFTTPDMHGTHRMRIKTDWSSTDPGGNTGDAPHTISSNNHIIKNGGMIIDVTLVVLPKYTVTYNYRIDGITVATEEFQIPQGYVYPDPPVPSEFSGIAETYYSIGAKPEGTVTADVTQDITVTQNLPFETSSSFENANWYAFKFDFSDNYSANGRCFMYYKAGETAITLDRESTGFADNDLFCAVGNILKGFRIYNKAAGQNYILSSSTTMSGETGADTHPIMTDISNGVPSGNNEFWDITNSTNATNGFFLGQHGFPANRINQRGNFAYWTGGAGSGSTFVAIAESDANLPGIEHLYTFQNAHYPQQYIANTGNTCTDAEDSRGTVMIEPAETAKQYYISVNGKYLKNTNTSSQISTTTNKAEAIPYTMEIHRDMVHMVFMDATKTWASPYQNYIHCNSSKNLVGWGADAPATQWVCHEVEGVYVVHGTKTLSAISGYKDITSFVVTEGSTLIVDVNDFDLSKVTGKGNIEIASGKTLVVNVAGFDLTRITGEGNVIVSEKWTSNILTSSLNITYTGGAGTTDSRVSINHTGDQVTLTGAEKTYYLTGSNSGTQTTVNFDGTNVNYDNELGIGNAIYNINNTKIATPKFITSQGQNNRSAVVNLTGNSVITVTGNSNADSNQSSIMIGHWNGSSNLTLSGTAQIVAADAQLLVGKTRNNQTITLNDNSNITAKGIKVSSGASGTNTLNLEGGSLNLGDAGITAYGNSMAVNVNGNTTITATAATLPLSQPITVASGKTLTINGGESKATVTLTGTLNNNGTVILEDAGIGGSARITTSNTVNIKNLAGNNISGSNGYAFVGSGSLNFYGTCDLTKQSDGTTENTNCKMGYGSSEHINIKEGANVTTGAIFNTSTSGNNSYITVESGATLNAQGDMRSISATNNGTMSGTALYGPLTLGDGSITTLSDATPFHNNSSTTGSVTVNGDATLNLTATTSTLTKAITVVSGKTLTIDGKNNTVVLTGAVTNNGTINFKNATLTANLNDRTLANYTFTDCTATLQFVETGDEYKNGGFTITNIPSGVTIKVKKYGATDYETVTPTDGTVTISHSVEVSGSAAWLDYTFNLSTKDKNTGTSGNVIKNAGNAGESGNDLTLDNDNGFQYTPSNSYNDNGTLKVMSTPWRNITWPTNYTVAVAGNVPDIENGCLVAFGTHDGGYLAILRGDANNKILLVKGKGNNHFETISTMTAANATELSHLVVFTKNGNTFTVYLDGVQKTQVTYSETLGGGFQIGSIHGGVTSTGIERVSNITDATIKAKVFAKAVRVYNYVISDDQMSLLTQEFPYTSFGGKYTRTITENSNLYATDAWLNTDTHGNVDIPVNAVVDEVTYYPDVEITTTAASTLTVNANMDSRNIEFNGAGKLTIASDGEHNIHIYGSVTANGPVSVKYGEIDLTAVPVSIGESGSVEFDFSASDFSGVTTSTDYPITGNTSDYGNKVTGVYPSDIYHTFTITHKSTTNSYYLTVGPSVALKRQQAINLVTPYYDGGYVGTGLGKYTISLGETSYAEMSDFETAVMSWESLEEYVEPTISLNMPANGFYRFTSQNNSLHTENVGKYLHNSLYNGGLALNTTKDETTIFYVDCENNRILSYADGKYLYNWDQAPTVGNPGTWTIMEGSEIGKYAIEVSGSQTWYVSDWDTTDHITYGLKDANALWAIEAVDELPLTLSEGGYTSFSAPVPIVIPEDNGEDKADYYAYYATSQDNDAGVINMRRVTGNVPENTGLIIYTKIDNPTIQIAGNSTPLEYTNLLVANVAASNVSRTDNYFFGKVSGNYVFTKLSGDDDYQLPGHKAYLNLSSGGARMSINWGVDDPTGLSELRDENIKLSDGKYYQNGRVVIVRNGVKYNVAGQTIK